MPIGRSFMPISGYAINSLHRAKGGELRTLPRVWWSSPGLQGIGCRGKPIWASEVTGNGWALGWKAGIITYGMFTCWVKVTENTLSHLILYFHTVQIVLKEQFTQRKADLILLGELFLYDLKMIPSSYIQINCKILNHDIQPHLNLLLQ